MGGLFSISRTSAGNAADTCCRDDIRDSEGDSCGHDVVIHLGTFLLLTILA